jgi:hypothetical protein
MGIHFSFSYSFSARFAPLRIQGEPRPWKNDRGTGQCTRWGEAPAEPKHQRGSGLRGSVALPGSWPFRLAASAWLCVLCVLSRLVQLAKSEFKNCSSRRKEIQSPQTVRHEANELEKSPALTPALSPRRGGSHLASIESADLGAITGCHASVARGRPTLDTSVSPEDCRRELPLPGGEGRGEGDRSTTPTTPTLQRVTKPFIGRL